MHKFVRRLLTEWRRLNLPFAGETFVAAVSGGADSVSLLLALHDLRERKKIGNRLVIAHFNHDLRGQESENDAEFVKSLCLKYNFELALEKGNISRKGNLEQNARFGRYAFLQRIAENVDARGILNAHTMNDQAETFLLHLIRGSGLKGLSGMKPVIDDFHLENAGADDKSEICHPKAKIALVRPLLSWAGRRDTENFCRELKIEFRNDTMNEDLSFRRVRLRKTLIPMLEEFNPRIIETLARTSDLIRFENEHSEETENRKPKTEKRELEIRHLRTLSASTVYREIRSWLAVRRGSLRGLELKHVEAIARLASSTKSGRAVELPNKDLVIKRDGKLFFQKTKVEKRRSAN